MQIKVYLHGYFKEFHEGPVTVIADTIAEAVTIVTRQLPGFQPNAVQGRHRVRVSGCDNAEDVFKAPLTDEVHLVPQFSGGKSGGFLQILLGAVLLAVGFFVPGLQFLMQVGVMMILGGIASFLAPTPANDANDKDKSRYLGAPRNTVEIGTRIPILCGEYQVFGHYLSFDIDAVETKS